MHGQHGVVTPAYFITDQTLVGSCCKLVAVSVAVAVTAPDTPLGDGGPAGCFTSSHVGALCFLHLQHHSLPLPLLWSFILPSFFTLPVVSACLETAASSGSHLKGVSAGPGLKREGVRVTVWQHEERKWERCGPSLTLLAAVWNASDHQPPWQLVTGINEVVGRVKTKKTKFLTGQFYLWCHFHR